jgi:hypothetical protein
VGDSWHLVHIVPENPEHPDAEECDDDFIVYHHRDCPVWWHSEMGVQHDCGLANEVRNDGWDQFFHRGDDDPKSFAHGWWWVRIDHITIRGLDWSEIDVEVQVLKAEIPDEVRGG